MTTSTEDDCLVGETRVQRQSEEAQISKRNNEECYRNTIAVIHKESAHREIFLKTLVLVARESDHASLTEQISQFPEMKVNLRTPQFYLDALVKTGALEKLPLYDSVEATKMNTEADFEEIIALSGEKLPQAVGTQPQDSEAQPQEFAWTVTEVGRAINADYSPMTRTETLCAQDPTSLSLFISLLALCTQPRSRIEVETYLKESGSLEGISAFASYYLDRLEQSGGLIWDKGWTTTEEGRAVLNKQSKVSNDEKEEER